jgi:hypothetical protein
LWHRFAIRGSMMGKIVGEANLSLRALYSLFTGPGAEAQRIFGRLVRDHQVVLVMLSLAGIGWLAEARFGLFEWYYEASREYEALQADGLVPCALLVLLGAFLDTYRAHQHALRERERIRAEMNMALRAAEEINEPLALIIANLEMVVPRMHPGNSYYPELRPVREAAWTILDRVRELTEIATLSSRERARLPSLITAVDGRPLSAVTGDVGFAASGSSHRSQAARPAELPDPG